ncbi:hypothetical protein MYX78_08550 [Acidobacteria bacterium AH-259-G07]|nr:hypothetical protein [Acidobacteria bacterium AH-259-G07]
MRGCTKKRRQERGIALIFALLVLLGLSTLAASITFVAQTETWSSYNYKLLTQARYLASAGEQRTINWLTYTYTPPTDLSSYDTTKQPVEYDGDPVLLTAIDGESPNYPDSTVQNSFYAALHDQPLAATGVQGTYSANATLLRIELVSNALASQSSVSATWQITSQGEISGVRTATVQVVTTVERGGEPIFQYAVFGSGSGCDVVSFGGGGLVDSFDSSQGTYSATVDTTDGDVGSNGNIYFSGTVVNGTLSTPLSLTEGNCLDASPNGISLGGGAVVTEGYEQMDEPWSLPNPPPVNPTPPTSDLDCRKDLPEGPPDHFTLAPPGEYGNIKCGGGKFLHLQAGTYNINSIQLGGGAWLVVDSGPIVINVAGNGITGSNKAVDFGGGSIANEIANLAGVPSDLLFVYGGSQPLEFSGGSGAYGLIYAPNAEVSIGGGGHWYGAIVANTLDNGGGSSIHYDRSLGTEEKEFYLLGSYRTLSFSRSKF